MNSPESPGIIVYGDLVSLVDGTPLRSIVGGTAWDEINRCYRASPPTGHFIRG